MKVFTPVNRRFLLVWPLLLLFLVAGCAHGPTVQEYSAPWKFAVISDTQGDSREDRGKGGINGPVLRAIAEDIVHERPDFVLVAGDLISGWTDRGGTDYASQFANWRSAMEPVYRERIEVFPVRGNHEVGPDRDVLPPLPPHMDPSPESLVLLERAFRAAFMEPHIPRNGPHGEVGLTYSFVHKNALVIGLDQYYNHPHKINQEWLTRQLAVNRKPHIFVYGHEPAFEVRHKDSLSYFAESRDAFWDALGAAGGGIYFCGHDHLYNRALIPDAEGNQIRQVIVGTGGGRLVMWSGTYKDGARVMGEYSNSAHHGYVLVTVDGSRVAVMWKALFLGDGSHEWRVLDSFSYCLPVSSFSRARKERCNPVLTESNSAHRGAEADCHARPCALSGCPGNAP